MKILTVDDVETVHAGVKEAFKEFDCEVITALNGAEGLTKAVDNFPDVILLDVEMPVMNGIEMLSKLKKDKIMRRIPVIMLTARTEKEVILHVAKLGIRDYIVKPFQPDLLVEKVARVVQLPLRKLETTDKIISTETDKPDVAEESVAPANTESAVDDLPPVVKRPNDMSEAKVLLVEDKPVVVKQMQELLAERVKHLIIAQNAAIAIDACLHQNPDVVIISLSLSEDSAFDLFEHLNADPLTRKIPVIGMAVKTDVERQEHAKMEGVETILTKPIHLEELLKDLQIAIDCWEMS